ncbi:hypothetical protein ACELLULO517_21255 [Acidisoma cellulosilytica]|uniref:MBL fold metallo-hydrolase n=1 Tax=Acidisoma cellulosilyticum TaxID=2802395 RepID=A0A963Z4T5_9PROT|nr:MBL fold metallo-hydrolase [Acidisoma cellulosilyticum]MCB8882787.1 hypothetical protein [Acidisoma cellulosilyticum]
MAKSIELYPLGVGDAYTERFWFSHMMLVVDGRKIFIDCPPYIPKMLAENNRIGEKKVVLDDYRELIVTHMHADHVGGIEELSYQQYFRTDNPMKMYAPQWLLQDIWSHLRPAMEESCRGDGGLASLDWYFDPIPMQNPHDMGGFKVEHRFTKHYPRTLAYLFDFGNFKLGYSSDAGFDPEHIAWLDQADVVLHDCCFGPMVERGGDVHIFHASREQLLTLPKQFQEKTFLYHYADKAYDQDPAQPNYDIGAYRLLVQNKIYKLL